MEVDTVLPPIAGGLARIPLEDHEPSIGEATSLTKVIVLGTSLAALRGNPR